MPDLAPQQGEWLPDPTERFKLRWQRSSGEWTRHVYDHDGNPHNDPYTPQPAQPKPRKKRKIWRRLLIAWVIGMVLIVGMAVIGSFIEDPEPEPTTNRPATTRPAATPTTARTMTATELFEDCVSPWDGNHEGFEALIRAVLNDPGSMETHGTYYNPSDSTSDGEIGIRLDYGARNALGGMVRTNAYAMMGMNCEITEVVDYGF